MSYSNMAYTDYLPVTFSLLQVIGPGGIDGQCFFPVPSG